MGGNNVIIQEEKINKPKLTWEEIIYLAKQYNKVVVSGCQRTGAKPPGVQDKAPGRQIPMWADWMNR